MECYIDQTSFHLGISECISRVVGKCAFEAYEPGDGGKSSMAALKGIKQRSKDTKNKYSF